MAETPEERLPVSETVRVLSYENLFKTGRWWSAVALVESFGRRQVALYLWHRRDGGWRRRQKYVIRSRGDWARIREVVDRLVERL